MKCECQHEAVCAYRNPISDAVYGIIKIRFSGHDNAWDILEKFVRDNCQYRASKSAESPGTVQATRPAQQQQERHFDAGAGASSQCKEPK
jgi:hypothetical protein